MADEPVASLGNKTLLQAANIPTINRLAKEGRCGMLNTVPDGFHPGSEIANLSVMGYEVAKVFEGRGSLEAASMGVDIREGEMAMRVNLICIADEKIKNHSAGHISNEEAHELINYLQQELGDEMLTLHPGVSYRHLLVLKGGNKALKCTPPHDVPGTPYKEVMIEALAPEAQTTADYLNTMILRSQELLASHPVNLKRVAEGKDPANSLWPWSPGYRPAMKTLQETYGIESGSVISAVDLIMGIGVYAGLTPRWVEGATGLYNTNYEGKVKAALDALRTEDFVYLHLEASDEAGHEGNVELKLRTIKYLEERVVKPIVDEVSTWDEPVAIAILPDHPTPCHLRTHTRAAIPFLIYKPGATPDAVEAYDEMSCTKGSYGTLQDIEFLQAFLNPKQ